MIKIGITGATGSLGKIILKNKKFKISPFKGDIRKKNNLENWIKKNKFKIIFHLAAIVPIKVVNKNKKKAYDVNYNGTKNLIDLSLKYNVRWFFFSSTSHVYKPSNSKLNENSKKDPISYYGFTKLKAEKYIIDNLGGKINYCIGRIFSTTNKNQKKNYLVPDLKNKIKKAKTRLILKNLNHYRDFISMIDISKIIFVLMKKNFNGVVNIGSGKKYYLKDIAKIILKKFNKKAEFEDEFKSTCLVSNNLKLKRYVKYRINSNIKKMIF